MDGCWSNPQNCVCLSLSISFALPLSFSYSLSLYPSFALWKKLIYTHRNVFRYAVSLYTGAVSEFLSGGCKVASEASWKFKAPPCQFLAPPCRGVPTINLQTNKQRADIWLMYLLLYIIFSRYKHAFFNKTLHIFTLIFI